MSAASTTWAVVLAAGDGRRLHELTTTESGVPVPKQFCSLRGGPSLLRDALERAGAVASARRTCVVVAESHRRWWEPALASVADENIIVQPRNRGTANGILLPLLHIERRAPGARVVLLPSDHHVDDERMLATALRGALRRLGPSSREMLLLGIAPDEADPELGYIVPGQTLGRGVSSVERFVEKPPASTARQLIEAGALWNAFIVAAHASTLIALFDARFPWIVQAMRRTVARDQGTTQEPIATADLYTQLADIDFSKHLLEGAEAALGVVKVPRCGWSDLGTPTRLAETLRRLAPRRDDADLVPGATSCLLNLSAQYLRLAAGEAAAGP